MRDRAVVARRAHNPEAGGSSPSLATKFIGDCFQPPIFCKFLFFFENNSNVFLEAV